MTSYLTSMDNISLTRTVFEIFDFKVFRVWPWPLTPKSHLGSTKWLYYWKAHIWLPIWLLWTPSLYLVPFSRYSTSKFSGFDLDLWSPKGHLVLEIAIPFESPYMTSYLASMDSISLSLTVFEIFDFKVFRVWPWPLTPEGHLGSEMAIPFESPYMTSYLASMDSISLSRTVFEIFDFKVFRVWPWPLILKGHLGLKIAILFESPYMTSYLTSMDNISLSRTVFEIFDFKVFRVWPWPLTPKGHLGSKCFIPFESPYMTSYLTSMDNISLSRTVFEIFDFKVFRVWPWPLTPKGHLGSKNFIPLESPYMTSYLTSMDTISLSRTVLEIMPVKILKAKQNGGFWPFKGQGPRSIFFYHRKGTSSHQTASFEILRIKIGSAV